MRSYTFLQFDTRRTPAPQVSLKTQDALSQSYFSARHECNVNRARAEGDTEVHFYHGRHIQPILSCACCFKPMHSVHSWVQMVLSLSVTMTRLPATWIVDRRSPHGISGHGISGHGISGQHPKPTCVELQRCSCQGQQQLLSGDTSLQQSASSQS